MQSVGRDIPGGKLCLILSAFSESLRMSVYRKRLHRILNLIWFEVVDFLIRAAASVVAVSATFRSSEVPSWESGREEASKLENATHAYLWHPSSARSRGTA